MSGNARDLYSRHERATVRLFLQFLSIARVHRILLLKTVKLWVAFFRNNLTPTDERKDTKADEQQRTHWSELERLAAKHGANARWHLRVWLNYCLDYICPDRTKPCHSLLTFICTAGRYSWLFLRVVKSRWINFLSERFKTIASGLNPGVTYLVQVWSSEWR